MKISVDFDSQSINIDGKRMHWFNGYYSDTQEILEYHSSLVAEMRKYFVIDNFNYADLIMPLVYQHDYFFQKEPGSLIIYNYLDILDSISNNRRKSKKNLVMQLDIKDFYKDTFLQCAIIVSKSKDFKIQIINNSVVRKNFGFIYESNIFMKSLLKFRISSRYILGSLRRLCGRIDKNHADVIFLANIRFFRKNFEDNLMFGSIISELNKRKVKSKTLFYEEIVQSKNISNLLKNYAFKRGSYIGDYYSLRQLSKNNRDFKKLKQKWLSIRDDPIFKSKFVFKGYNYYDIIRPRFDLVFESLSYLACDIKNISEEILLKEKYKLMVIDHAENILGKGFMINSRLDANRKILALSHEQIYPGCVHTCSRSVKSPNKRSVLWRPIPDLKCVWGYYARDVLLKYCAYDNKNIRVTGNPKFDWIFNETYDKKSLLIKNPIFNSLKKKILIVSSNMMEQYKIYLEIAKENPSCLFIFKPHPNESMVLVNNNLKGKISNLEVVDRFVDTYSLIYLSDYVMMFNSTAGFEAMLFKKIVFMIDYNGIVPDGIPFKDSRAIIEVKNGLDVKRALIKLNDSRFEKQILNNVKKFVDYIHYKNDGGATKRVADEIDKLLK